MRSLKALPFDLKTVMVIAQNFELKTLLPQFSSKEQELSLGEQNWLEICQR